MSDAQEAVRSPRGAIRDQGYQRYQGVYTSESGRWALIAGRMLKMSARQPWVVVMLILCIFPALVGAVLMYIQAKMYAAGMLPVPPDPYVFHLFTKPYGTLLIAFLTALFAGGGAVADDVRLGAFPFYFARPVTREQYLVGKVLPPVVLVLCVSLGPALLLAALRIGLAKDQQDALGALLLPLRAIGFGLIEALAFGVPVVALSSLSRGRGYVQGAFAALFLLPWILGAIFVGVTRSPWPAILSTRAHLLTLGHFLFSVPVDEADRLLPVWVSAAALAALIAGSLALLRHRLASIEVVGS
jgi:ABC-2 type transport system permease protein